MAVPMALGGEIVGEFGGLGVLYSYISGRGYALQAVLAAVGVGWWLFTVSVVVGSPAGVGWSV